MKAIEQLCESELSSQSPYVFHLHASMCHSFPFIPHLRGAPAPTGMLSMPLGFAWRLDHGPCCRARCDGDISRCHPQLWPVAPLNTTCTHTPPVLWLWGQSLVISTLKSPPTPLNSNLQCQGQQQEPKPRKWDHDPSGKERRSQN